MGAAAFSEVKLSSTRNGEEEKKEGNKVGNFFKSTFNAATSIVRREEVPQTPQQKYRIALVQKRT